MKRLWVVSYDIADDRRRYRVARWLLGHGDRVLESVFECVWRAEQAAQARVQLHKLLDPGEDMLTMVPVCQACLQRAVANGQGRARLQHACHIV
jgi:CRISPR-associated protein Cas2